MLSGFTVFTIGGLTVALVFQLVTGWTSTELAALCPGSDAFCAGVYWTTVADNLPTWLIVAQILVLLALASPYSWRAR